MIEFQIQLEPKKSYKVAVFVCKNEKEFKKFILKDFKELKWEDSGIAFYLPMEENNRKKWVGALFFNREFLDVFTVNHEVYHLVLDYLKYLKKHQIYKNEINEERFVYLTEFITKKLCKKLKITEIELPSEKILNKDFEFVKKEVGF